MARPKIDKERREEIIAAFEACVVRRGLAATTLSDVATEASLPRSLVRYFVGNRDDMVELLIARMVARAEDELTSPGTKGDDARTVYDVVDFLFDRMFADATSNAVVDELWNLAERDDDTRARLEAVYTKLVRELVKRLRRDPRVNATKRDIEAVAFALMSLAYGEVSFRELGVAGAPRKRVRKLAHGLAATLIPNQRGDEP